MKFLYVSRQFNRSGYYILEELLRAGIMPVGVLLPFVNRVPELDEAVESKAFAERYEKYCQENQIPPLRFFKSIKLLANSYSVPVFERETLKDQTAYDWIKSLELDMIVLGGGWPELIPVSIIRLPKVGLINTHPSLLPEFRGTDIHRWQVLHGVKESGATIHYIDETFDTGDIIAQARVEISPTDYPQDLFEKTAKASGMEMVKVLRKHEEEYPNRIAAMQQSARSDKSRYFSRWRWEDPEFMKLDWSQSAEQLRRKILASTQEDYKYNGPFAMLKGKKWIFRKSECRNSGRFDAAPGTIVHIGSEGLLVTTSEPGEQLLVTQIQAGTALGFPAEPNTSGALSGEMILKSDEFFVNSTFE